MTPDKQKKAIDEYKQIYKQEYGVDLSDKEASEQAAKLLQLFDVLIQPKKK